nr:PREDICTED: uncharacterized protein LOC109034780 isoform X2 [Bemisia tabaci]
MKVLTILIISIHAVLEGDARMDTRRRNYGSQQMYSFFVKKLGISTHISSLIELKILSLAQSGRISTERLRIMAELDCKLEKMSKVWKSSLKINLYGNSSLNYHSIQQQTE